MRLEDRVEPLHRRLVAADHQAVAAHQAPDAAGGADVEVVDALGLQLLAAADVVDVVGVAAVDQDVALLQQRGVDVGDLVGDAGRDHQPDARGGVSLETSSCGLAAPTTLPPLFSMPSLMPLTTSAVIVATSDSMRDRLLDHLGVACR